MSSGSPTPSRSAIKRFAALLGVLGVIGYQAADVVASSRGRAKAKPKTTTKKVTTTVKKVTTTTRVTTTTHVTTTAVTTAKPVTTAAVTTAPVTTTPADPGPQQVDGGLTITGPVVVVRQWGNVQISLTYDKLTGSQGGKPTITLRLTACNATGPDHTARSSFITTQAIPTLCQETLTAQSANIRLVSGASDTSNGFIQSLQAALTQAAS